MPPGTLDRTPPPFFKQGTPALTKLLLLSALAVLLMVLDVRLRLTPPLRSALATVLYPVQWVALQPVHAVRWVAGYLTDVHAARQQAEAAQQALAAQADRAGLVEHLAQENRELRALLGLREQLWPQSLGAEILYALPDPYRPGVVIDRGTMHGVQPGDTVMDGWGVLGQVTRAYPGSSEVTLLVDRRLAVPVLNTRSGERYLAFGNGDLDAPTLTLRFVPAQTDTVVGDTLVTSGIDGVYPPGLPVAQITRVEAQGSGFAWVEARPLARVRDALHVLVLHRRGADTRPAQGG
ncbi:MAG: rod shape-determining protein MreC [Tepidimonas ignava]|nr:rod shape-determining protein MreC [Tepidimonas ignava]